MTENTNYIINEAAIKQWAHTVFKLIGQRKVRKTLKWWKSKNAKIIWGTEGAKVRRNALRQVLQESV